MWPVLSNNLPKNVMFNYLSTILKKILWVHCWEAPRCENEAALPPPPRQFTYFIGSVWTLGRTGATFGNSEQDLMKPVEFHLNDTISTCFRKQWHFTRVRNGTGSLFDQSSPSITSVRCSPSLALLSHNDNCISNANHQRRKASYIKQLSKLFIQWQVNKISF